MASIQYARMVLRRAGQQVANREARVVRRVSLKSSRDQSGVLQLGAVTSADYSYTGAAGRQREDDPHQSAFWVCMVDQLLSSNPGWGPAFRSIYVEGSRFHPEERDLAMAMANALGPVEEDESVVARSLKEYRLEQMTRRRENQARYAREARARRKLRS